MTFKVILGLPQILGTLQIGGKSYHPRAKINNNSRIPATDSGDPETEIGNLEAEKRVHRIHGTLETRLHDASQPGCPLKGGRRISKQYVHVFVCPKVPPESQTDIFE